VRDLQDFEHSAWFKDKSNIFKKDFWNDFKADPENATAVSSLLFFVMDCIGDFVRFSDPYISPEASQKVSQAIDRFDSCSADKIDAPTTKIKDVDDYSDNTGYNIKLLLCMLFQENQGVAQDLSPRITMKYHTDHKPLNACFNKFMFAAKYYSAIIKEEWDFFSEGYDYCSFLYSYCDPIKRTLEEYLGAYFKMLRSAPSPYDRLTVKSPDKSDRDVPIASQNCE
jgi:hypothetical protein